MNPSTKTLAKYYKLLAVFVWLLIALGGAVRAMNAGLACPDWPLCFGDVIPDYHPQVYFEFIHRVIAGVVSLATLALAFFLFRSKEAPKSAKWLAVAGLIILVAQVVLGGLTVLWHLHAKVVAAHLGFGIGFFSTLLWIYFQLSGETQGEENKRVFVPNYIRLTVLFVFAVLSAQILLGGLVASHYAARVCTDFPKCNGEWIPTLSGALGLHVMHRLNAYFLTLVVVAAFWLIRAKKIQGLYSSGRILLYLTLGQVGVGIANVLWLSPPLITVIHLALAAALAGVALRMVYLCYSSKGEAHRAAGRVVPAGRPQASYSSQ